MPQDCNDGNKASYVENDDANLNLGQQSGNEDIDEYGRGDYQPSEERSLPHFRIVRVCMVEDDQALQYGAGEDGLCCDCRNPGQRCQPADDVAAEDLVPLRSEHVHPVVLTARDRSHRRQFGDDRVYGQSGGPGNDEAIDKTSWTAIVEALAEEDSRMTDKPEMESGSEKANMGYVHQNLIYVVSSYRHITQNGY